jgi:signal transduction histidine kinase
MLLQGAIRRWCILLAALAAPGVAVLGAESPRQLTIAEIIALPPSADAAGSPVSVRGMLTYYEPGHRMAFLQDGPDAIYVHVTDHQDVSTGDYVEVSGFLDAGLNGRNIRGPDFDTSPIIQRISSGTLPEPRELRSLAGIDSERGACWSSVEVQVASVSLEGDRARLMVAEEPQVPVFIMGISRPSQLPGHLRGLRVRVHGVLADAVVSDKPLVMQRQVLIPGLNHVVIPKEEFDRQFDGPEATIAELRWIHVRDRAGERTKLLGVVTWRKPGEGFFIQRGTVAAWIQCAEPILPELNQRVICAGQPSSYHGAGILRNAIWKECGTVLGDIVPMMIESYDFPGEFQHGRLTNIQGRVLETLRGPTEDFMILQVGKEVVFSHLQTDGMASRSRDVQRGSIVSITGTFLNRPSPVLESGDTPGSFHILPRGPGDMKLVAAPPFWTPRRMLVLIGAVLVVAVLSAVWVVALRRKVRKQSLVIRSTVARQAVEEERVRIARDWHDMFEQHFAGLTMLMDAAVTLIPKASPAAGILDRAARMADHSRSEARQAIWDLRAPSHDGQKPFADELEESLRAAWPESSETRLAIHSGERAATFPRPITLQLLRIATEAVTNAFKHASPGRITVTWEEHPESWQLSIQDDGKGIPANVIEQASSAGHFGLLGMRERALRLQATLQIVSPPAAGSTGTLIRLIFPKPDCPP